MYQFFESIKIFDGKIQQLEYHQERVNVTFKVFYPDFEPIKLAEVIHSFPNHQKVYKCRFSYNATFYNVEFIEYKINIHEQFKLIDADKLSYNFKYVNRDFFIQKKAEYPDHELIFIQNHQLTDTTYSNLVFFANNQWYTPKSSLLKGTMRESLLDQKKIETLEITKENVFQFKSFKLINAMLDLENSPEYYTDMIEL